MTLLLAQRVRGSERVCRRVNCEAAGTPDGGSLRARGICVLRTVYCGRGRGWRWFMGLYVMTILGGNLERLCMANFTFGE